MDSFVGFFLILLITYETATTTANATTDATYTSPATTDTTYETAATIANATTDDTYTSPATTDIPTTADFELVPMTTTPKSIPDGSHANLKAEPDHGTERSTIADGDKASHETGTRYGSETTTNAPSLGARSGIDFDTELEISTTHADIENSTHINLENIKDEVLQILKPTKEIIEKLEGASTSKPAEPLSKDTTAKRSVTQEEAAGILIGSLVVAVAIICVTKIVYNRYKMKTYDVAQNTIELGNP